MFTNWLIGLKLQTVSYSFVMFNVYLCCDYSSHISLHEFQSNLQEELIILITFLLLNMSFQTISSQHVQITWHSMLSSKNHPKWFFQLVLRTLDTQTHFTGVNLNILAFTCKNSILCRIYLRIRICYKKGGYPCSFYY